MEGKVENRMYPVNHRRVVVDYGFRQRQRPKSGRDAETGLRPERVLAAVRTRALLFDGPYGEVP